MGTISSGIIEVRAQSDFAMIEAKVPSVSCAFSKKKDLSATYNDVPLDYLGPTLPAFLSPNVLGTLVKMYELHPTTTPEDDLKAILGEACTQK